MNACLHKLRSARLLLALLVLPGLAIRAGVPPGFMPAADAGAAPTMAMCPGHSALPQVPQSTPTPAGDTQPQQQHHSSPPCVFAAAAGGAAPALVATAVFAAAAQHESLPPRVAAPAVRHPYRAQAPRGPPAIPS